MTDDAEVNAFGRRMRQTFGDFLIQEQVLREQYSPDGSSAKARSMLERTTRRFLIDDLLAALDWDPDSPNDVSEEARGWSVEGDRYYFDYLGLDRSGRSPALLFEAKAYDVSPPHGPGQGLLTARDMSVLIADALAALHAEADPGLVVDWIAYLTDLKDYVASLKRGGALDLSRVAISAGRWLIVFEDPLTTFDMATPDPRLIHCFTTAAEIVERADEIYDLLHRRQLVDALPFTLPVQDAFEVLSPTDASAFSRGVLVATTNSGAKLQPYPTRSVYPVILWRTAYRWFAIVDLSLPPVEPMNETELPQFLAEIRRRGEHLDNRISEWAGRSLPMSDITSFPGLTVSRRRDGKRQRVSPTPGSTNWQRTDAPGAPIFVVESGEGIHTEFIVATGLEWHYKHDRGPAACRFHSWKAARDDGVASVSGPVANYSAASFTEDGQRGHCAHGDLVGRRKARCHILQLETNLCCQACELSDACWPAIEERDRRPCPRTVHSAQ